MAGHIDFLDNFWVKGWAVREDGDWPEVLEVRVDGEVVGYEVASIPRPDVRDAGFGDGRCGFEYAFEPPVGLFRLASVEVRAVSDGRCIDGEPQSVSPFVSGVYPVDLGEQFVAAHLASVEWSDDIARCRIFVSAESATIHAEGATSDIIWQSEGPTEATGNPWLQAVGVTVDIRPRTLAEPLVWLEVTTPPISPSQEARSLTPLRVPVTVRTDWATSAEEEHYRRTTGTATVDTQVVTGVQTAAKVDQIIGRYGDPPASARILDWGVGAGRVAVPLKRLFRPNDMIVGVDVDTVNVSWCQEHLQDIPVELSDIYPPLGFESESFDVVFGISVMTHLTQAAQIVWLRELRRILRPGGLAILSVHGDHAIFDSPISRSMVLDLSLFGISDHLRDEVISVNEPGYYRSTFQTRAQVMASWSPELPVVAYLPRANAVLQDFVVLQKPWAPVVL